MPLADAALVLGIIGAVTGSFGTLIALVSFVRDRPKLEVRASYPWPNTEMEAVKVQIANHGRQPLAIAAVGLGFQSPPSSVLYWIRDLRRRLRLKSEPTVRGWMADEEPRKVLTLEPGHAHRETVELGERYVSIPGQDLAFWVSAWDSRGREARSERVIVSATRPYRVISRKESGAPV